MRYAPRALLAGGLGLAVSFLVACGGGSGLLSSGNSSQLNNDLNQVASAVSSGQCAQAANAAATFNNDVSNLPSNVSPALRNNLSQGATTVADLAPRACTTTTTTTKTSTSTTSPTTTKSSTTTSTSTTTPPPTSTTTAITPPPTSTSGTATSGGAGLGGAGSGGAGQGQ